MVYTFRKEGHSDDNYLSCLEKGCFLAKFAKRTGQELSRSYSYRRSRKRRDCLYQTPRRCEKEDFECAMNLRTGTARTHTQRIGETSRHHRSVQVFYRSPRSTALVVQIESSIAGLPQLPCPRGILSRSRLFLGGLLSSIAHLRFASQAPVRYSHLPDEDFSPTANSVLTVCVSSGGTRSRTLANQIAAKLAVMDIRLQVGSGGAGWPEILIARRETRADSLPWQFPVA